MSEERREREVRVERDRCPFCHDAVRPTDEKVACDGCMAWHHAACWRDHGTCAACGFSGPPSRPERPGRAEPATKVPVDVPPVMPGQAALRARRRDANAALGVGLVNVAFFGGLFAWLSGGSLAGEGAGVFVTMMALGGALAFHGLVRRVELKGKTRG